MSTTFGLLQGISSGEDPDTVSLYLLSHREDGNGGASVIGTGTRCGRMSSRMVNFLDQTGGLWMRGTLNGKIGSAFTSTASPHGGQETKLFVGGDGKPQPPIAELEGACFQGRHVAKLAAKRVA